MNRPAPPTVQRGVALWMLLILVAMAGGYAFYRSANNQFNRFGQDAKVSATLVRAKEALIARAVTDANRPGSLPCPDLNDNPGMQNVPYDGKTDSFIGAATGQCPSNVGWLPWATLDLPELTDDTGSRLWYVLSPALRDDDSAQPINSDTNPSLTVDGNTNNDIVALIIAPRGTLAGQDRSPPAGKTYPALNPAAYLDGENGNGDNIYVTGPQSDSFNDIVLVITRQELMAAVEKRVVNELRACLQQHASSAENPTHTFPPPAPLAGTAVTDVTYTNLTTNIFVTNKGNSSSLFGRVPDTQPGNPQQTLKDMTDQIRITQNRLVSASTAEGKLEIAKQLQTQAAYAMALYDRLFIAAVDLESQARAARDAFQTLDDWLAVATSDKPTYDGQKTGLPTAIEAAQPGLHAFRSALANSGLDLFLVELDVRNPELLADIDAASANPTATNFKALLTSVNQFKNKLLEYSWTSNTDIDNAISAAYAAAKDAAITVRNATKNQNEDQVGKALAAATTLYNANRQIETAVLTSRAAAEDGDNIAQEILKSAAAALEDAQVNIPANVSAARKLTTSTDAINYWSKLAVAQAADLARSARRGIVGGKVTVEDSDTSAYTAARKLLDSLDGDSGTIALLDSGSASAAALAQTNDLLTNLLAAAERLAASLQTGQAEGAVPVVWYGAACAFLQPTSSQGTWWTANQWKTLIFYQLSGATQAEPAKLTVNGTGTYLVVTLAAGRALAGQNRATLSVENFLEEANKGFIEVEGERKETRDGDAPDPAPNFTAKAPSATFNDRLAY